MQVPNFSTIRHEAPTPTPVPLLLHVWANLLVINSIVCMSKYLQTPDIRHENEVDCGRYKTS